MIARIIFLIPTNGWYTSARQENCVRYGWKNQRGFLTEESNVTSAGKLLTTESTFVVNTDRDLLAATHYFCMQIVVMWRSYSLTSTLTPTIQPQLSLSYVTSLRLVMDRCDLSTLSFAVVIITAACNFWFSWDVPSYRTNYVVVVASWVLAVGRDYFVSLRLYHRRVE